MDFSDIPNLPGLETILEVEQDGQILRRSMGDKPFQAPIHITFTIEEQDYQKFLNACNLSSQQPYEALIFLCKKATLFLTQHKKGTKKKRK